MLLDHEQWGRGEFFQVPPLETAALIFFVTTKLSLRLYNGQTMFKSPESALLPRGSQLGGWAMKLSGPLEKAQVSPICGQRKKGPSWFVAIAHAPPAFDGQSAVVMASGVFRQSERIGHLSGAILPDRQRNEKKFFALFF